MNLQSLFCGIIFCLSITALIIACLAFTKGKGGIRESVISATDPSANPGITKEQQAAIEANTNALSANGWVAHLMNPILRTFSDNRQCADSSSSALQQIVDTQFHLCAQ